MHFNSIFLVHISPLYSGRDYFGKYVVTVIDIGVADDRGAELSAHCRPACPPCLAGREGGRRLAAQRDSGAFASSGTVIPESRVSWACRAGCPCKSVGPEGSKLLRTRVPGAHSHHLFAPPRFLGLDNRHHPCISLLFFLSPQRNNLGCVKLSYKRWLFWVFWGVGYITVLLIPKKTACSIQNILYHSLLDVLFWHGSLSNATRSLQAQPKHRAPFQKGDAW